jgi:hypothetical protein
VHITSTIVLPDIVWKADDYALNQGTIKPTRKRHHAAMQMKGIAHDRRFRFCQVPIPGRFLFIFSIEITEKPVSLGGNSVFINSEMPLPPIIQDLLSFYHEEQPYDRQEDTPN